jgi:hypothetical protein
MSIPRMQCEFAQKLKRDEQQKNQILWRLRKLRCGTAVSPRGYASKSLQLDDGDQSSSHGRTTAKITKGVESDDARQPAKTPERVSELATVWSGKNCLMYVFRISSSGLTSGKQKQEGNNSACRHSGAVVSSGTLCGAETTEPFPMNGRCNSVFHDWAFLSQRVSHKLTSVRSKPQRIRN